MNFLSEENESILNNTSVIVYSENVYSIQILDNVYIGKTDKDIENQKGSRNRYYQSLIKQVKDEFEVGMSIFLHIFPYVSGMSEAGLSALASGFDDVTVLNKNAETDIPKGRSLYLITWGDVSEHNIKPKDMFCEDDMFDAIKESWTFKNNSGTDFSLNVYQNDPTDSTEEILTGKLNNLLDAGEFNVDNVIELLRKMKMI